MSFGSALEFEAAIANELRRRPSLLPAALAGVAAGMEAALRDARERAGEKDAAALAALAMMRGSRLTPGMKAALAGRIALAVDPANASPAERAALELAGRLAAEHGAAAGGPGG